MGLFFRLTERKREGGREGEIEGKTERDKKRRIGKEKRE